MTRLEAKPYQAGMRRRCPVCYWEFTIPRAEQVAAAVERSRSEYELSPEGGPVPGAAAYQTYVAVICPVCQSRMYAGADQVGQEITCPDCETRTKVPAPAPGSAAPATRPNTVAADDEYPLYQGEGQPTADRQEVYQPYIPVVCRLCQTRMLATVDQVGQEMICPDCGTTSTVPPPAPRAASGPFLAPNPDEQYSVGQWDWWETTAPKPAPQKRILAVCPLCHTRLDVSAELAGRRIKCRDCGSSFEVPPAAAPPQPNPMEEIGDEYALAAVPEAPKLKPAIFPEAERREEFWRDEQPDAFRPVRSKEEEEEEPEAEPEEPPRWPFVSGVFGFPFYPGSIPYWAALAGGAILAAAVAHQAFLHANSGPLGLVVSLILAGVAAVVGVAWIIAAAAIGLSILQDTSEGCDAVTNWPQGQIFDWIAEFLFVFNSLALAVLLGLGLRSLFQAGPWLSATMVAATVYAFFPIFLVSMLESGSPLKPFSAPIWRSVLTVGWAWGVFYVETGLIAIVVVVPAVLLTLATSAIVGVPAIAVIVAALMIYFRLLGRLIWYCAQQLPDEEETEEDGEEAEDLPDTAP